jgi:selenocysteine lyase/cysteine desulfurase
MRAQIEAIGELCRGRGLWYALDAAQAMGVLRLDPAAVGADVVAAHGYKFLLSGFGLALTYCSERVLAEVRVPQVGWKNARVSDELTVELGETAARFESTMSSIPLLAGMVESLRLLRGVDEVERERHAVGLIRSAADRLRDRGYAVVSSTLPEEMSSVLSLRHPSLAADEVARRLRSAGVACAAVDGCLRISAHFFNTTDDVDALLAALPAV